MNAVSPLSRKKTGYLPSLDGWRALAIFGVMLTHDTAWIGPGPKKPIWQDWGGDGVYLFFALSGVLITTRILEEERLRGFFDIRGFYIRRFFRIQPPALVYLGIIALLMLAGILHDSWHYWFGGLFLYENFLWKGEVCVPHSFFVGHFWTLAVEEHFYILLSIIMLSFRRYRIVAILSIYLVLMAAQRYAQHHGHFSEPGFRRTYWQLQFLLFPAALAIVLQRHRVRQWAVRWMQPWRVCLFTIVTLYLHHIKSVLTHNESGPGFVGAMNTELGMVCRYYFALWVVSTMLHPEAWTTRVLELKPLRWLGKISYSLYLWHVLFFFRVVPETHVTQPVLLALSGKPAKYIAAVAMAALSFYLLELPMMRLGHRLAPPAKPGRPELIEPREEGHHDVARVTA